MSRHQDSAAGPMGPALCVPRNLVWPTGLYNLRAWTRPQCGIQPYLGVGGGTPSHRPESGSTLTAAGRALTEPDLCRVLLSRPYQTGRVQSPPIAWRVGPGPGTQSRNARDQPVGAKHLAESRQDEGGHCVAKCFALSPAAGAGARQGEASARAQPFDRDRCLGRCFLPTGPLRLRSHRAPTLHKPSCRRTSPLTEQRFSLQCSYKALVG